MLMRRVFFSLRRTAARREGRRTEVVKARLLFARQLLVMYGVPYECVWSMSGFSSMKDMERHWNDLF